MAEYGGEVLNFGCHEWHRPLAIPSLHDLDKVNGALVESHKGHCRSFCNHVFQMKSKETQPSETGMVRCVP